MSHDSAVSEDDATKGRQGDDSRANDEGQAIQINENTIADPGHPERDKGDDDLHSRNDVPKRRDQGIQINENTIADPDGEGGER